MRALVLLVVASVALAARPSQTSPYSFELQQIADGVYVAVRKEHPGLMFNANSVFVVTDEDVVVVDTNITPSSAAELLAALRKVTSKPVRFVVNTHFHDDHVMGNQVFAEAFPGVQFVAHATTREDMTTDGVSNRKQLLEGAPPMLDYMRKLATENKSLGGWELTPEERASYASDIAQVERYIAEAPSFRLVLPTITVEDRLTLHRGGRTIEVLHLGPGHSRGDLVVNLPEQGIVVAGDLVGLPTPLAGLKSDIGAWAGTLEKLLALKPKLIVPGHGPVLRDDAYVRLTAETMASISRQVEAAVARGETLEQARKSVDVADLKRRFAGDSKLVGFVFDYYVAGPAVRAAFTASSAPRPAR